MSTTKNIFFIFI